MQLATLDNVTLLEGNHEANLRDYGLPDGVASKEFRMQTAPELAQAGLSRKAVYNFYRKLSQCFCYTYQGKKVLVSHGGLARMPENLSLVATAELVYGTGVYEDALDVDICFAKHAAADEYRFTDTAIMRACLRRLTSIALIWTERWKWAVSCGR